MIRQEGRGRVEAAGVAAGQNLLFKLIADELDRRGVWWPLRHMRTAVPAITGSLSSSRCRVAVGRGCPPKPDQSALRRVVSRDIAPVHVAFPMRIGVGFWDDKALWFNGQLALCLTASEGDPVDSVTEIKAGKTITLSQLTRDITAANRGLDVDYRFAGNPITGNHGPDPDVAARLNAAQSATNGRFNWAVTDVSPSSASLHSVETAAKVSRAARVFGRVAAPIGLAADTYSIGSAIAADGGRFGRNTTVAVAGSAGGWAGAAAGGWAGVQTGTAIGALVGGPAGAAVGAVVGGLIGAVGGGWFGGWGGEKIARAATD